MEIFDIANFILGYLVELILKVRKFALNSVQIEKENEIVEEVEG